LYDTLIHAYVGKSVDPAHSNQMSLSEYKEAMAFIRQHFFVIHPKNIMNHTPDYLLKITEEVVTEYGIDAVVFDPYNKMMHDNMSRDDIYIAQLISKFKDFSIRNQVEFNVVAHPKTIGLLKDGTRPRPTARSVSGGIIWEQAVDCVVVIDRPNFENDRSDPTVDFHVDKMKNQKLMGRPGMARFTFDIHKNRYYDEYGSNPIEKQVAQSMNSFPITSQDAAEAFENDDLDGIFEYNK